MNKVLMESFKKCDVEDMGELSFYEFSDAWEDLELTGDVDEVQHAFERADTSWRGVLCAEEFIQAMKRERIEELRKRVLVMALENECKKLHEEYRRAWDCTNGTLVGQSIDHVDSLVVPKKVTPFPGKSVI